MAQRTALASTFPEALLFCYAKGKSEIQRDFKWLGSYRYGILHLAAADAKQLRIDCERASALLGWPAPYASEADSVIPACSTERPPGQVLNDPETHT
jgi:hypothetical protein